MVRERRLALGLTQAQLSEKSGINPRQIRKIESGEIQIGNLTLTNAMRLADALGIKIEDLLSKGGIADNGYHESYEPGAQL